MLHKMLVTAAAIVTVVVLAEVVALLIMHASVSRYAGYWRGRAAERAGDPDAFVYVALGDSAAQGIGATRPQKGYVGLLADDIANSTDRPVRVVNLSRTGAKLQDVLMEQLPRVEALQPDLITLEIGSNDIGSYDADSFHRDFGLILDGLPAGRTVVATIPYFGGRINAHGLDAALSDSMRERALAQGFGVAGLYDELRTRHSLRIYSADYFHPSDHGYRIWYDAFRPAVSEKLAQRTNRR